MLAVLAVLTVLAACGGDGGDDLDPDAVTSIPPGDATGTGASGVYTLETITTACDGDCTTEVGELIHSACDVGTRLDATAEVAQTDGLLTFDVDDSDYVSRLGGGIDADGGFEVGGLRTQQGGAITITARSTGVLTGSSATGAARLLVRGMGLSCRIEVDLTAERLGS